MTKVDKTFNQIMNEEVLPAINKAFCSLSGESQQQDNDLIQLKADQMQCILNTYIEGQAKCFQAISTNS